MISIFKQILHFVNNRLSEFCGLLLLIIVFLISITSIFRSAGVTVYGLVTISVMVMIAVIYLGLSRAEEHGEHASIDLLSLYLPAKWIKINNTFIYVIELVVIILFLYFSIKSFISSYQSQEIYAEIINLHIWPVKLAICVGLFFYFVQVFVFFIESIFKLTDKN
jgi:TRAP-type C4-dicarboxylate transport system permease small subunit